MATAVAPRIVGLEDNETTLDLPGSLRKQSCSSSESAESRPESRGSSREGEEDLKQRVAATAQTHRL